MHLGQTASNLALLLNRPEPTSKMISRLLREGGWVKKGSRGRNAPHVDGGELSAFLIAFMCCPDSPAVAVERLPHFAGLLLESETETKATFKEGLALLLDRLASETWDEVWNKNWGVSLHVDMSAAQIKADPVEGSEVVPEDHVFSSLVGVADDQLREECLPYLGGLQANYKIHCVTLFRIAKVVLAGEPDPVDEIRKSIEGGWLS